MQRRAATSTIRMVWVMILPEIAAVPSSALQLHLAPLFGGSPVKIGALSVQVLPNVRKQCILHMGHTVWVVFARNPQHVNVRRFSRFSHEHVSKAATPRCIGHQAHPREKSERSRFQAPQG